MSIQSQIEALEQLAEIDAELLSLEGELTAERGDLGGKRAQLNELESKLAATEASVGEMERVRNDLVTEARQMSVQMERSRDKLNRCRTEREVNAAQREVEELRKLFKDRENEIGKLADLIEQARVEVEGTTQQRDALAGELGASAGEVETRLSQLEAGAAEKRARREEAAKAVPVVMFRKYEMIRKRRGSALAYTTSGTCSACNMALAPMMFQVLRRGQSFDQCPSCNRILYFRPEAPAGSDAADSPAEETGVPAQAVSEDSTSEVESPSQ